MSDFYLLLVLNARFYGDKIQRVQGLQNIYSEQI